MWARSGNTVKKTMTFIRQLLLYHVGTNRTTLHLDNGLAGVMNRIEILFQASGLEHSSILMIS